MRRHWPPAVSPKARHRYGPHDRVRYYATFVADPDGNRIEAVTFPQD